MKNWKTRHDALSAADGDEWDQLSGEFDCNWKAAYSKHFVDHALSRGWEREDAESWSESIVDDALLEAAPRFDWCPQRTAENDVIECERECANG